MNAALAEVPAPAEAVQKIAYPDGSVIEWTGKAEGKGARRVDKEAVTGADGVTHLLFKFRWTDENGVGKMRDLVLNPDLLIKFAEHGALQKYGDQYSGITDPEEIEYSLDELHEQLTNGAWKSDRAPGPAGSGLLARALITYKMRRDGVDEATAKKDAIAFLAKLDGTQKEALQTRGPVSEVYIQLKAEKAAKQPQVDPNKLLEGF